MACSSDDCGITFEGDNGIRTIAKCNTVIFRDLRNLSPYVVDANGDGEYATLCDAIKAANQDTTPGPVTIFILPGTYQLCNELESARKINFVGVAMGGQPKINITGTGTSWGGKGWFGVTFFGEDGQYTLDNPDAQSGAIDTFRNCQFTDDFQITTSNDVLFFFDCFFNYGDLSRNNVIEVTNGMGQIRIYSSRFFFSRLGSTTAATSLIHFGANTATTRSIIMDSHITGFVDGSTPFVFANVTAQQQIIIQGCVFVITGAGARTILIGNTTFFTGAQVIVEASTFIGPGMNTEVIGEIWSGGSGIILSACLFLNIRVLNYATFANLLPVTGFLRVSGSWIQPPAAESAFNAVLTQGSTLEIMMHGTASLANAQVSLMTFSEIGVSVNTVTLRVTCNHFRNTNGVVPPWVTAAVDVLNIFHESTSLSGYGVATNTGVINNVTYSTTLS